MLNSLESTDRATELLTRLRKLNGRVKHPLHPANHLGTQRGRRRFQCSPQRAARIAISTQRVGVGHLDMIKYRFIDFARPVHRRHRLNTETSCATLNGQECETVSNARYTDHEVSYAGIGHEEFSSGD